MARESALDTVLVTERMAALLTGSFELIAALLVATGLFGILAREVAIRTREIAIRRVPGALAGSAAVVLVIARWLALLLVDVRPADPAVLTSAVCFLFLVAAVAVLLREKRPRG